MCFSVVEDRTMAKRYRISSLYKDISEISHKSKDSPSRMQPERMQLVKALNGQVICEMIRRVLRQTTQHTLLFLDSIFDKLDELM